MTGLRRVMFAVLAAMVALVTASWSRADLPGPMPLSAAGDGHLWWVVRADAQAAGNAAATAARDVAPATGYALMHHALDEPRPTERLVMRFPREPDAIAADGCRVVVATAGERGAGAFIVSMFAVKNEATGLWFTLPQGIPRVLPSPPVIGEVRAMAVAGDVLFAIIRVRESLGSANSNGPAELWFGSVACESGAAAQWTKHALPDLDMSEPVRLFARGGTLAAEGARDGRAAFAAFRDGKWSLEPLVRAGDAIDARATLGGMEISGRSVLVERAMTAGEAPRVRLGLVRDGQVQPWAEFEEPTQPWSVAPFGGSATLLEVPTEGVDRGHAVVRGISFSQGEPLAAVSLAPPGFVSGSWIHLPILGVLSVALVLAAVIFGSEAYLEGRMRSLQGKTPEQVLKLVESLERARPRGASLGRRGAAMAIDLLPGLIVVWAIGGGRPGNLLQIPAFLPDLGANLPAIWVFAAGWAFASLGDVIFGRSLGKWIVGLRVIRSTGGPASAGRRALRSLASAIAVARPVVMLLSMLHPRSDGPAEMLPGTAVVDARAYAALESARSNAADGPSGGNDPV